MARRRLSLTAVGRRSWLRGAGACVASAGLGGCRRVYDECGASPGSPSPPPRRPLRVWAHQGRESENAALQAVARAFERASGTRLELGFFPDHHYTERLAIAAAARDMPDAYEVDGPLVARFAEAQLLAPLDAWFSSDDLDDFLPSIRAQGSVGGSLFALGAFDSAAVLYHDRRLLHEAGVHWPSGGRGPTWPELLDACARLAALRATPPLSMHMSESADEWFTFAFSPVIWSGGGRLIAGDADGVRGVLASPENVRGLSAWQRLFTLGFASSTPVDPDPFGHGRAALDWNGHWMARSHVSAKGSDLGVTRLPRSGPGRSSPCGSYCWGVYARSPLRESGAAWVRWVTGAETGIRPLVAANAAVPARRSAFALFPEFAQLPYSLFRQQLEHDARPRPRTAFYPTLTREFASALRDIARGADVAARLSRAENAVQDVIDRRWGAERRRAG